MSSLPVLFFFSFLFFFLQVYVELVPVAFCPVRRAHETLPQAHGGKAIQVQGLRALLLTVRPPVTAHEATSGQDESPAK